RPERRINRVPSVWRPCWNANSRCRPDWSRAASASSPCWSATRSSPGRASSFSRRTRRSSTPSARRWQISRATGFEPRMDTNSHESGGVAAGAHAQDKGQPTREDKIELPPPTAEEAAVRLFAEPLIRGTLEHRNDIDEQIKRHAQNWDLHRMAVVDRNVLRLAIYEMFHREDI